VLLKNVDNLYWCIVVVKMRVESLLSELLFLFFLFEI